MQQTDALVVGGGPVGSFAALHLAKLGVKVSVFEEHPEIGKPSHCAGHLSIKSLKNMGLYPLPQGIIENTFNQANFYSSKGTKFALKLSQPVTAALDRTRFDQYLAQQAEAAGALFNLSSHAESLIISEGFVKGVTIQHLEGREQVYSRIVLDAEGISSRLLRQTGLKPLKSQGLVYAVEAEVDSVQAVEPHAVEVYLGKQFTPGFYGWLIPRPDGSAKVGLAADEGNPRELLQKLMCKHPIASKQLSKSKITKQSFHAITLGGPIDKTYANGLLAVGDCASQVKPTTGGGVIFGLTCAKIAAETAIKALNKGDFSADYLQQYQKRWSDLLSFDFAVMLRLRRFLNSLSDEKLDDVLRFCNKMGINEALSDVNEIDFQGKLMLKLLGKPAIFAAMFYFLIIFLSANP